MAASYGYAVLVVAEKPSIASAIALALSTKDNPFTTRGGSLPVHELERTYEGKLTKFKVTSVIGHVYSIDFHGRFQSWDTEPGLLFDADIVKKESNPKARVCHHLSSESKECNEVQLFLDCDREGENICFEVLDCIKLRSPARVRRAKFSAVTPAAILEAMKNLGTPNENESKAVDARQELDLRTGVAFTRYQTRFFQGRYGNLDSALISYGPCQTPTLGFVVDRHINIMEHVPETYYALRVEVKKSGVVVPLLWERGRVFDQQVCAAFALNVSSVKSLRIASVSSKRQKRSRPTGLNTVAMLKIASSQLGMGPHHAMQVAERLYIQGYLSYPRTESTGYPPGFDLRGTVASLRRHPMYGAFASALLESSRGPNPRAGHDAGDHPPITPCASATAEELGGGDSWRLYEVVVRHFLAGVSEDATIEVTRARLVGGGEAFLASGRKLVHPGFLEILPSGGMGRYGMGTTDEEADEEAAAEAEGGGGGGGGDDDDDEDSEYGRGVLPPLAEGESLNAEVSQRTGKTRPPDHLTESNLITLMERNGIGTDASIPTHINNIIERRYANLGAGRRLIPTDLGVCFVQGLKAIDSELVRPLVRGHVEKQLDLIARGDAAKEAVVEHIKHSFRSKFDFFVGHIGRMDALFENRFSPLASSGKPFTRCGRTNRILRLVASRPPRLYNPFTEEVLKLPDGGECKQYKGLECPICSYELCLYKLGGSDSKSSRSYPLCPGCYNFPPFKDDAAESTGAQSTAAAEGGGGPGSARRAAMCLRCPMPEIHPIIAKLRICACPETEAEGGVLMLDPAGGPGNWRVISTRSSLIFYLPKSVISAKVLDREDDDGCRLLSLEFHKDQTPLEGGATKHVASLLNDELLEGMITASHGSTSMRRRGGGRGGGRGRGRGRGRGKRMTEAEMKMSFYGF